jgi:hypothetical protein
MAFGSRSLVEQLVDAPGVRREAFFLTVHRLSRPGFRRGHP